MKLKSAEESNAAVTKESIVVETIEHGEKLHDPKGRINGFRRTFGNFAEGRND